MIHYKQKINSPHLKRIRCSLFDKIFSNLLKFTYFTKKKKKLEKKLNLDSQNESYL